ncbi:MAG TPA: choice-of-anchor Q domain-containing protein [Rhodanobacteraceae bacterium]|jgi:hypothetical protein|nr:choice-of-anchor Q domain-containing protein [Rhodanobacteraceae bacterium]
MNGFFLSALHESRRKQIAACIASVFCLAAPTATLAVTVTSCLDDGGGGTLRSIVTGAAEGATVDFAGLDCTATSNKITLANSYIKVNQNSLTIDGSGAVHPLSIDASGLYRGYADSRVLTHVGTGTLAITKLTLENGYILHVGPTSYGGCLWSAGNVTLSSSTVTNCSITHNAALTPLGGAVYVKGNLILQHSTVSQGYATGTANANGGGVYVKGNLSVKYSTIAGNKATGPTDGAGGAAFVRGNVSTKYSTISGNSATNRAGGVFVNGNATFLTTTVSGNSAKFFAGIDAFSFTPGGNTFQLGNSTISGNTATSSTGGIYVNSGKAYFYNSTIAFNNAPTVAGVLVDSAYGAIAVELQSTLMSNNSNGGSDFDFKITTANANAITINGGNVVTPANNLIRATNAPLPNDTRVSCPLLGPLSNNGGLTKTHALGSTSSAIDHGNTVGTGGGAGNYDQRGSATVNGVRDYIRQSRPVGSIDPAVADIGAYEVQQDDEIFDSFFEGCNSLI